ncbi:MAG: hypothetical protein NTX71_06110 [Candidatus Aureabacteria bacterium]|nr:hypothetical protein [Candidatus Auribacterota bacterium]
MGDSAQVNQSSLHWGRNRMVFFLFRNRFAIQLVCLASLILLGPSLRKCVGTHLAVSTNDVLFVIVLLSGLWSVTGLRVIFRISFVIGLLFIIFVLLDLLVDSFDFTLALGATGCLFIAIICVGIVRHILILKRVSRDTVFGGVCVYMLMGYLWAGLYTIIEVAAPGSFATNLGPLGPAEADNLFPPLMFLSYSALTTSGFGDVSPVSLTARGFVILEAISGQIFLVTFIAFLLGLHIASLRQNN